jgi:NADH:ubiquinone reductase (H+-translocating)
MSRCPRLPRLQRMNTKRLVVIGGGYAGVLAAVRAARRGGRRVEVTLLSERPVLVERIRLHERAARGRSVTRPLAGLLAGSGVELEVTRVVGVDGRRGRVDTEAGPRRFDAAIVAVGSQTTSALPGAVHASRLDLESASALYSTLTGAAGGRERARRPPRLLVVGGGLSGIELAAELCDSGADVEVTLATSAELAPQLSSSARHEIRARLEALGVTVREHAPVRALEPSRALGEGWELQFDHAVLAGGFRAAPLLAESGFDVDESGRVPVDATLRPAGHERVFVAGDAARVDLGVGPLAMGCKTAMPEGAHAADNAVALLRGDATRDFGWRDAGSCVSLGRRRGAIQLVDSTGGATERVVRGRPAALLKELVCRYTLAAIHLERAGLLSYRWPSRVSPRILASSQLPGGAA